MICPLVFGAIKKYWTVSETHVYVVECAQRQYLINLIFDSIKMFDYIIMGMVKLPYQLLCIYEEKEFCDLFIFSLSQL